MGWGANGRNLGCTSMHVQDTGQCQCKWIKLCPQSDFAGMPVISEAVTASAN